MPKSESVVAATLFLAGLTLRASWTTRENGDGGRARRDLFDHLMLKP
jgi:hypothetical protein